MTDLAEQLVAAAAPPNGVDLTGENSLLTMLNWQVLQSALEVEIAHHLGYDKSDPVGRNQGNAVSNTFFVNCFNSPPGPVNDKPCSFAIRTNSRATSFSADGSGLCLVRHNT